MKRINKEELHRIFIGIKDNNELEFNNLCEKYRTLIYGISFSILKNKDDSEEVVQNVLIKIYKLDKAKLPSKKETNWLYSMTKNEAISLLRKKKEHVDIDTIYEITDKNDEINKITEKIDFNKLISKLNDKEKEIVSLRIISNLTFNQIAKLLGEPTGTIKWRYYNAVHILKILISNIGMFAITLLIEMKTLFSRKQNQTIEHMQDEVEMEKEEEETSQKENNREDVENKKQEGTISNSQNKEVEDKQEEIKEDTEGVLDSTATVTIKEDQIKNINYFGTGTLILSSVFLISTIITLIFFTKYQLNLRKKASK